jgi:membrane-bound lytic murein transglycosylase D
MAAAIVTRHAGAFGFGPEEVEAEHWVPYETITVPRAALLSHVAEAAEVAEKALLDLNPELRRTCTPPRPHAIKVPKGQAEAFARNWEGVSQRAGTLAFVHHRVKAGETLAAVAQAHDAPPAAVQRMNGLRPGRRLRPGTELVIPVSAQARSAVAVAPEPPERERPARRARVRPAPMAVQTALASGRERSTVLVVSGDTLWAIAQRFGVALEELCRWNGIPNPRRHKLLPGDELVVYGAVRPRG